MAHRVCPWWLGYFLVSPLRRWRNDPQSADAPEYRGSSILEMPDAAPQPWIARRPGVPAGRVEKHRFKSEALKNEREIAVYLPPRYSPRAEPYPLLVLFDEEAYLSLVPLVSYRSIYSAAKSAVNSLTENLRKDLRDSYPDIAISLVFPGAVNTDFVKKALGGTPRATYLKPQDVEEVADLMVDLIHNPKPALFTDPRGAELARAHFADALGL
jgi:NAD(P)-dependent dehydrogenase (short-subunit alcohol dehydrogenase family)